jgi:hypothetical protein
MLRLPISAVRMPILAKTAQEMAKLCRFCVLRGAGMPKTLPILPISVYTM